MRGRRSFVINHARCMITGALDIICVRVVLRHRSRVSGVKTHVSRRVARVAVQSRSADVTQICAWIRWRRRALPVDQATVGQLVDAVALSGLLQLKTLLVEPAAEVGKRSGRCRNTEPVVSGRQCMWCRDHVSCSAHQARTRTDCMTTKTYTAQIIYE